MSGIPVSVVVSKRQRMILERWVRNKADRPGRLIERCQIILMSAAGVSNAEQGRRLGSSEQRPRRWRRRWAEAREGFDAAESEGANDKDLAKLLENLLDDLPRSGVKPTFTPEQLAMIIAVACELPADSGRPVTHWTPRELTDEVIKRGIVDSISPRHVDRLLKGGISGHTKPSIG